MYVLYRCTVLYDSEEGSDIPVTHSASPVGGAAPAAPAATVCTAIRIVQLYRVHTLLPYTGTGTVLCTLIVSLRAIDEPRLPQWRIVCWPAMHTGREIYIRTGFQYCVTIQASCCGPLDESGAAAAGALDYRTNVLPYTMCTLLYGIRGTGTGQQGRFGSPRARRQ